MRLAPALLLLAACGKKDPPPTLTAPTPTPALTAPAPTLTPAPTPAPAFYPSPRDAFLAAVASAPLAVAIGEAHAPKGSSVPSATRRFTTEILPSLEGRASDLLVELMAPPNGCAGAAAEVRTQQAPATSRQAETNQNEYVTLGDAARKLGVVPDLLRPACADLDGVRDAGDHALEASLEMIARLSLAQATRLVDRDARTEADRGKMVLVYGGMLHSDLAPPPERASWAYAPALGQHVGGRIVEVDLVVPEFIAREDPAWQALAWLPRYDAATMGDRTVLLPTGPKSYVLVFPRTPPGQP